MPFKKYFCLPQRTLPNRKIKFQGLAFHLLLIPFNYVTNQPPLIPSSRVMGQKEYLLQRKELNFNFNRDEIILMLKVKLR